MAGIGFELYKILQKGTLGSILKVLLLGTIIVAGPWILSVASIYMIQKYAYMAISEDPAIFTISIVYVYAFSLILFGGAHYIFSRYIADMMYIENDEAIPTALLTIFFITILFSIAFSLGFILLNDFSKLKFVNLYNFSLILLFIVINLIWLMLIYIALLKEYNKIFFAYLFGVVASIFGVLGYGKIYGVAGALFGYTLGQLLIVLTLLLISLQSYPIKTLNFNREIFSYFKDYKYLFFIGLFFNSGIWVDKILYWAFYGKAIEGTLFYYYAKYDIPVFLAFLTMIPALVYFLVIAEPGFHREFTNFIKNILQDTLSDIKKNKERMLKTLQKGIGQLALFQVVWTIGLILNTKSFLAFMNYEFIDITILNILFIAVLFHILSLTLQIYLLYMELRTEALLSTVVYFLGNTIFTSLFIYMDISMPGAGYALGALISSSYSGYHLYKKAPKIDYYIFTKK